MLEVQANSGPTILTTRMLSTNLISEISPNNKCFNMLIPLLFVEQAEVLADQTLEAARIEIHSSPGRSTTIMLSNTKTNLGEALICISLMLVVEDSVQISKVGSKACSLTTTANLIKSDLKCHKADSLASNTSMVSITRAATEVEAGLQAEEVAEATKALILINGTSKVHLCSNKTLLDLIKTNS
jgi:hypothetical protein